MISRLPCLLFGHRWRGEEWGTGHRRCEKCNQQQALTLVDFGRSKIWLTIKSR